MSHTFRFLIILLASILMISGCAHLHPLKNAQQSTVPPAPSPAPPPKNLGVLYRITHPLAGFHPFARKAQPPRAVALRRIGTIRTISTDGSFVIVEMEPAVMVSQGSELLVMATGGEPSRLKVSDIKPPYFVADILTGNPEPGDLVRQ